MDPEHVCCVPVPGCHVETRRGVLTSALVIKQTAITACVTVGCPWPVSPALTDKGYTGDARDAGPARFAHRGAAIRSRRSAWTTHHSGPLPTDLKPALVSGLRPLLAVGRRCCFQRCSCIVSVQDMASSSTGIQSPSLSPTVIWLRIPYPARSATQIEPMGVECLWAGESLGTLFPAAFHDASRYLGHEDLFGQAESVATRKAGLPCPCLELWPILSQAYMTTRPRRGP